MKKLLSFLLLLFIIFPKLSITAWGAESYLWPVPYASTNNISQGYGGSHYGIDISCGGIYGQSVCATKSGTVFEIYSGCSSYSKSGCGSCSPSSGKWNGLCNYGYGNGIVIAHDDGTWSCYGHLSEINVYKGQRVTQGTVIGKVGSTGDSTGPHLHFEIGTNVCNRGSNSLGTGTYYSVHNSPSFDCSINTNPSVLPYVFDGEQPVSPLNSVSFSGMSTGNITNTNAVVSFNASISGGVSYQIGLEVEGVKTYIYPQTFTMTNIPNTYDLTAECGIVLQPGTNYRWRALVKTSNQTYYSDYVSFKTTGASVSFSGMSTGNITNTNAVVNFNASISGGVSYQIGLEVEGVKTYIYPQTFTMANIPNTYDLTAECGIVLQPGTNYRWRALVKTSNQTYYSDYVSFKTTGASVSFSGMSTGNITNTNAVVNFNASISGGVSYQIGLEVEGVKTYIYPQTFTMTNIPNTYDLTAECGIVLQPGTNYRWRALVKTSNQTYYSNYVSFKTEEGMSDDISIQWTNLYIFPSKHSAYLTATPIASRTVSFTDTTIKVWDSNKSIVIDHTDVGNTYVSTQLPIWYELASETGVSLKENTAYYYQLTVKCNGKSVSSDVMQFTTEDNFGKRFGIDVSEHQGQIDWNTASEYIDFAILRCGYSVDLSEYDDKCFRYNASECERLGVPYGVYLYSYAENTDEARSEAKHVLRMIENHKISMPVYYDLEDSKTTGTLTTSQISEIIQAFCSELDKNGYSCGVYSSYSWWNSRLDKSISDVDKWLAGYSGIFAEESADYSLWQFSSTGKIPGINGNVDLDYITGESIPGAIHTHCMSKHNRVEPTLDNNGNIEYWTCDNCGKFFSDADGKNEISSIDTMIEKFSIKILSEIITYSGECMLNIQIDERISASTQVFLAAYDANGRFLRGYTCTAEELRDAKSENGTLISFIQADTRKLFLLTSGFSPLCELIEF